MFCIFIFEVGSLPCPVRLGYDHYYKNDCARLYKTTY